MSKVKVEMTMSLDGFIATPDDSVDRLHEWLTNLQSWREWNNLEGGEGGPSTEVFEDSFRNIGAIIMGRGMFDVGEEPWGDEPPFHVPVFVVTHETRETLTKAGGTSFIFVTDGVESAIAQAKAAAGDKDVQVAGGAGMIQQLLDAGLVEEMQLHIAPVLLGEGIRLFDQMNSTPIEFEIVRVVHSPDVTHIRYRVA